MSSGLRRTLMGALRPVGVALPAALALLTALVSAADAAAACRSPHSWVAGTTALCRGTIVYGDYVDDDYGADSGASSTGRTALLAPSAGDAVYPEGQEATADLVRLTVAARGGRLIVTALLNAVYDPDSTVLAVAIDSDDDRATGGGAWGSLGVRSDGWEQLALFDHADPATNTISGTLALPTGAHWRLQALTGVRASGQVMNVAFRGAQERAGWTLRRLGGGDTGTWFEDDQAATLRSGDISRYGYRVDAADLRGKVTRAEQPGPGLHERVYESAYTVGPQHEGVSVKGVPGRGAGTLSAVTGAQRYQYLGRYQPYGVYVPSGAGPHGVQLVLHGSNSGFAGLINQPGMQQQFGEQLNRILVVPEARGSEGFGSDFSERDVLDVLADVQASYPVDADRVVAGGYSQGGYIATRLAQLHPDRFAGLVTWVGFTGNYLNGTPLDSLGVSAGAIGNVTDLLDNLRHVPAVLLYAGADELVHGNQAIALEHALAATADRYRFYLHPLAEHLTFAALDDWTKEARDSRELALTRNPPRVSFRTATLLDDPARGIIHDHAYWVRRIRPRKRGAAFADVDLTTSACAGATTPRVVSRTSSGARPVPWVSDEHVQQGADALERRDALEGALHNVASLRIAVGPTCLRRRAFSYRIISDGRVSVRFTDGRRLRLTGSGAHVGTLQRRPATQAP